jgi:hypothetical protein
MNIKNVEKKLLQLEQHQLEHLKVLRMKIEFYDMAEKKLLFLSTLDTNGDLSIV